MAIDFAMWHMAITFYMWHVAITLPMWPTICIYLLTLLEFLFLQINQLD